MVIQYLNQTSFTGPAITLDSATTDISLFISGTGPVSIERFCADGVWRAYPDLQFTGSVAKVLSLHNATYRVVITGGPTTVDLQL
jgi:hypothetical protein